MLKAHPLSTLAIAIASTFVLNGCSATGSSAQLSPSSPSSANTAMTSKPNSVIATVNGRAIGKSAIALQQNGQARPDMEEKSVDELVARELMRQEFEQQDIKADPGTAEKLDNLLRVTYSQLAAERFMQSIQINDQELRKAYEQKFAGIKSTQYKAKHILVEKEESGKAVIAKLKKGAKFDALAKKLSKDPGSKDNGGDLGWFGAENVVPAFAQAVANMQNGETSATPVQSQFGWHVIQREDSKEQQPPAFDEVKQRLEMALRVEKLQQHVDELKSKAKIEKSALTKSSSQPG